MSIEVFSSVMRGVGYSSVPAGICVAGICGVRLAYLYTIYPSIASFLISTMRLFTFCMNIHKMQVR